MNLNLNLTVTKKLCNKPGCIGGQAFENETNGLLYCCPEHADWSGFQKKKKKLPPSKKKRARAATVIQTAIRDFLECINHSRSSYCCEKCDKELAKEDVYFRKYHCGGEAHPAEECANHSHGEYSYCSEECFKEFRLAGDMFLCPHREDTCIGSLYPGYTYDTCDCDPPTKEDYEKYCFVEQPFHPWPEQWEDK